MMNFYQLLQNNLFVNLNIISIVLIMIGILHILSLYNRKNKAMVDNNYSFSQMNNEFVSYSLSLITKSILNEFLKSEKDANGSNLALRKISDQSDPFFHGLIVLVIGSMSSEMKNRFFTFFKRDKNESILINAVSIIIENYSMFLLKKLKELEFEAVKLNKTNVSQNKPPIDTNDYVFSKLTVVLMSDIAKLNLN